MTIKHNKAFTLLELLAAIALFSVIALGIANTLRDTSKLLGKLQVRAASTLSGQLALNRLQRDLQMAFNEKLQNSPTLFKATETSSRPELTFSFFESPIKTLFVRRTPGIKVAKYTMERADNGTHNLYRSLAPLYGAADIDSTRKQLVAQGVLNFKIKYYDARNDRWLDRWDTSDKATLGYFPKAVQINIQTVDPALPKEQHKKKSLSFQTSFMLLNELEGQ